MVVETLAVLLYALRVRHLIKMRRGSNRVLFREIHVLSCLASLTGSPVAASKDDPGQEKKLVPTPDHGQGKQRARDLVGDTGKVF